MKPLGLFFVKILLTLAGLAPEGANAQTADLLKLTVVACDATTVFLDLGKNDPPFDVANYQVTAIEVPKPAPGNPRGNLRDLGSTSGERVKDRMLRVSFQAGELLYGMKKLPGSTTIRFLVKNSTGRAFAVGDLSTQPKGTIEHNAAESSQNILDVAIETPLERIDSESGKKLMLVEIFQKAHSVRGLSGEDVQIPEKNQNHEVSFFTSAQEANCATKDGRIASFAVQVRQGDEFRPESVALRLEGLVDAYGSPIKVESDIPPPSAPKGKDDAQLYTSLLFENAEGAADSLSLDLKAQPSFQMAGSWLFRPELIASIAKSTAPATNSIRFAALFSNTAVVRRDRLISSTLSIGPSLEADRNFDRVNGLLDLRWEPGLAGLYHSRTKTRTAQASRSQKLKDAPLPQVGWGLNGWIGLEGGKSLKQQAIKNSDETGMLEIDRYDILRFRPLVHGFYENGPLTFDASATLRYLFRDELSSEEAADHSLTLRKIKRSRPYTEATLSWAFDPVKHFNLALTYKNGSEPPVFLTVKKYSLGFVAKY